MGLWDWLTGRMTPQAFARLATSTLRDAGEQRPIRYLEDDFALVVGDQGLPRYNLGNAYHAYQRAGRAQRKQILHACFGLRDLPEIPEHLADARAALLPVVRGRAESTLMHLQREALAQDEDAVPPGRLLGAERYVRVAFDSEHRIAGIGADTLKRWGLTLEDALRIALDNLRDRSPERYEQIAPGLWAGGWHDAYDCSRLLLTDQVYRLRLSGRPVALIPAREDLLVTGENDIVAQRTMLQLALKRIDENPRTCAAEMLVLDDGRWQPWTPTDPEVAFAQRNLARRIDAGDYATLKRHLEKLHQTRGTDVHIGNYSLLQVVGDNRLLSYVTWIDGVDSVLPRADRFAYFAQPPTDAESAPVFVTWDDAQLILDSALRPLDYYPPLYAISGSLDAGRRAALEAAHLEEP
jgi:hypothetical protein